MTTPTADEPINPDDFDDWSDVDSTTVNLPPTSYRIPTNPDDELGDGE